MIDTGLRFWLHYAEAHGGLWEPAGDSTLVVLPAHLGERHGLGEELLVTSDPDVAREDGVVFLGTGHPVLTQAAEAVLNDGDVGHLALQRPASLPPGANLLLEHARDQFPVDHGRVDLAGEPVPVTRPVTRVGALVTYAISTDDRFQEESHRWVDVPSRRELPSAVVERLTRTPARTDPCPAGDSPHGLLSALAEAHRLIEAEATNRSATLARQRGDAHQREVERAEAYYADVSAGIERRLETAAPERRKTLEARLASTRQERARRLAEITEKHQALHEIRPYRLHVIAVPALRVPVHVRRGERRYPMELEWLLPARTFAPIRCPSCSGTAALVAGKDGLGCERCRPPKAGASRRHLALGPERAW